MELKIARIKAGLTQTQLCKKSKISTRKIVEAERGNYDSLTMANMKTLANILNVDVIELFFSDDKKVIDMEA